MKSVLIGNTGVRTAPLCLGTMSFGGDADEKTSADMFARCRDVGINLFDSADVYQDGLSETILGKLVAGCRDQVLLTSKVYFPTGRGKNDRGASRWHIMHAAEQSLRRLGTDRIDIYYLHRFDDHTPLEESLRALDDLRRQGKILYPAVSNYAAWQTQKALAIGDHSGFAPIVATQPMYNLAKRQAEVEILPMATDANLAVFPYSPLGGGLLTGKYGATQRPASGRLIDNAMYQTRYQDTSYYDTAERFTALANELGHHPASLAVAWVASHPAVTAPILGARNLEQLDVSLAALDIIMTEQLRRRIAACSPAPPPATDRNEEKSAANYDQTLLKQPT